MYIGLYTSNVTLKNQLTFPSKLQKLTGDELFIAPWFEQSLIILPQKDAEKTLTGILQGGASLLPEVRDLESVLYANAQAVALDTRNRFVIEKRLKDYAKVGKEAVLLGIKDRIELWDKEVYENYSQIREKQIRQTAVNLYNRIISQGKENK